MQVKSRELAPKRHEQILRILREEGAVRFDALTRTLRVSPATIRRDLEELESRGELRRVHGGAVPLGRSLDEPHFDEKTVEMEKEKNRIAQAAADTVQSGETIYLDGGSTLFALARHLRSREDITVVTNSVRAAMELAGTGPNLILTGGTLRRRSQTLVGPLTSGILQELHVDTAFMGTMGITIKEGLTTTEPGEAFTKKLAIAAARNVTLLCDSSKFGKISFAFFGAVNEVHRIITDTGLGEETAQRYEKLGVTVERIRC